MTAFHKGKAAVVKVDYYIDKRFDYEAKMNLNTYELWEGQIIQITGGGLSQPVIIGNI